MENRIYYGEYSLKHWINMILKKKITLPEYQRSFVWSDKAVKRFIQSLKDKQFIPPVTIAHYKIENEDNETNLILDGQQRLTSLLLAAIDSCPDKNKFEKSDDVTKVKMIVKKMMILKNQNLLNGHSINFLNLETI